MYRTQLCRLNVKLTQIIESCQTVNTVRVGFSVVCGNCFDTNFVDCCANDLTFRTCKNCKILNTKFVNRLKKKRHRLFTTLLTFIVVFNAQHIYASTHCRGAPEEMAEQNRQQRKKISK